MFKGISPLTFKETISEYSSNIIKSKKQSSSLNGDANKETLLKRDEFNLNKLLVVVTSVGKVFGLHSSNGQIIWSFYLKNSIPFTTITNKKSIPLFVQRTAAHFPYDAQCAIISQFKTDLEKSIITFFNPLNGEKIKEQQKDDLILDFKIKQAFLANVADNHFLKPLIVLDTQNRAHVLPKSAEELIFKSKKPYSIYTADRNSISGFTVSNSESVSITC